MEGAGMGVARQCGSTDCTALTLQVGVGAGFKRQQRANLKSEDTEKSPALD